MILEIKWSDNPTVATGLARQLGEDYLLRNGLTHGIYLVGWTGASQAWRERAACETEMAEQARQFGRDHEGRRIDAFVMDLTWKAEPAAVPENQAVSAAAPC